MRIADAVARGFQATTDDAAIGALDIVAICVPTPLDEANAPNLSAVRAAATTIARHLRRGQLVVLESTSPPGTTRDVVRPILESSGLLAGVDFALAFSPEREDPGNAHYETKTIPKIVGADDAASLTAASAFYRRIVAGVTETKSTATAEAAKLLENTFRNVNIALVNELKIALDAMGVDIWDTIAAASTKPFGFMPFYPGPGVGGDCIPVSPVLLAHQAKAHGGATPLVDLAASINRDMPRHVARRVAEVVREREGKPMNEAQILMLGVCYKKNVEDTRVSASMALIGEIEAMGAVCDYHDPFFPVMPVTRDHASLAGRVSVPMTAAQLARYDAVVIGADHDDVDYALVASEARIVVDTRNVMTRLGLANGRLVKA
jgi:UDP-N-acetyl-D-glucosamine dehydrogenase